MFDNNSIMFQYINFLTIKNHFFNIFNNFENHSYKKLIQHIGNLFENAIYLQSQMNTWSIYSKKILFLFFSHTSIHKFEIDLLRWCKYAQFNPGLTLTVSRNQFRLKPCFVMESTRISLHSQCQTPRMLISRKKTTCQWQIIYLQYMIDTLDFLIFWRFFYCYLPRRFENMTLIKQSNSDNKTNFDEFYCLIVCIIIAKNIAKVKTVL